MSDDRRGATGTRELRKQLQGLKRLAVGVHFDNGFFNFFIGHIFVSFRQRLLLFFIRHIPPALSFSFVSSRNIFVSFRSNGFFFLHWAHFCFVWMLKVVAIVL